MTRRLAGAALAVLLSTGFVEAEEPKPPAEWEMTTYYVGLIRKGPAWTAEKTPEVMKLQEGHLANIRRLGDAGKLLVAGPFTDGGDLRGLFVFKVATLDEAQALCETDPAVKAGRLVVELHPWFAAKHIVVTPKAP
jgi:uncharacterized protein YciI